MRGLSLDPVAVELPLTATRRYTASRIDLGKGVSLRCMALDRIDIFMDGIAAAGGAS